MAGRGPLAESQSAWPITEMLADGVAREVYERREFVRRHTIRQRLQLAPKQFRLVGVTLPTVIEYGVKALHLGR